MEILNIGVLELIIIILLMFIVLGPKDMIVTAQRIGRWIRSVVRSPMWREIMGYSQEIRELPKKIMDETGLDETLKEVKASTQAAVNDVNASLKEAADAARVPEVEHLRLETGSAADEKHTILPPSSAAKPTSSAEPPVPAVEEPAATGAAAADQPEPAAEVPADLAPVQETAASVGEPAASEPAVLEVAEPAAPRKPRRKKAVVDASQDAVETVPGEAAAGAPVRKSRTRKIKPEAVELETTGAAAYASETPDIPPAASVEPELPSGNVVETAPDEVGLSTTDSAPLPPEELPVITDTPQRRTRARKPKVEQVPAANETGFENSTTSDITEKVPERRTRTRKPKEEAISPAVLPVEPVPSEPPAVAVEEPERPTRTRKTRVKAAPTAEDHEQVSTGISPVPENFMNSIETKVASEAAAPAETDITNNIPNPTSRPRRGARKYPVKPETVSLPDNLNTEASSTVEPGELGASGNGSKPHIEQPAEDKDLRSNAS